MCEIYHNRLMNEVARAKFFFSKNSNFDLDLRPTMLKYKLVQDIIILNNSLKLFQNWSINKSARAMTKYFYNSNCDLDRDL